MPSASAHVDDFSRDRLPPQRLWPRLRFDLPELQYPEQLNCADALLDVTIGRFGGERPCLITEIERWSYAELLATANRIARVLVEDLGLVAGNRVLLRGPNNPWLIASWFGVLKAGGVAVATMPLLRRTELATVVGMSQPRIALCDSRYVDELWAAAPELRLVTFGAEGELAELAAGRPADFESVRTAGTDVALLAFTSGTTGQPKATMHFHRDVMAIADTFSRHVLRPTADDVFIGTPPVAFTFGLGALLVFPLAAGASVVLVERATPAELAAAIAEYGVTVLFTAPIAYRALAAAPESLSSLRRCVSAGETLPLPVWEAFHTATGLKIIDGIGSTELLHIFIASADDDIRPGSTGKPVPGYTARVVGDDGEPVPDGQLGRLAVQGPTGCRYLDDDRQRSYVQDGWNLTGDTYVRDADGYFWFQARSDDMIISAGYNIAGPEVEQALLAHSDVEDCGVIGVADEIRGQLVTAYVVLRPGASTTAGELQDFVKATIAPYKYPRVVHFVTELPRSNTGKLQRYRLRKQA